MAKTITAQQRMECIALYSLANHHYAQARQFEEGLANILGADENDKYNGAISDAIYGSAAGKAPPIDGVLKSMGVKVLPAPKRRKPR